MARLAPQRSDTFFVCFFLSFSFFFFFFFLLILEADAAVQPLWQRAAAPELPGHEHVYAFDRLRVSASARALAPHSRPCSMLSDVHQAGAVLVDAAVTAANNGGFPTSLMFANLVIASFNDSATFGWLHHQLCLQTKK